MMPWGPERFDKVYGSPGLGVPVNLISRRSKALKRRVERITKRRERREAKKFEEQQGLAWLNAETEEAFNECNWYDDSIDPEWEVDEYGRYHHRPLYGYELWDDDDWDDRGDYDDDHRYGRRDCRVCDVQNEHDARFCKNCGVQFT